MCAGSSRIRLGSGHRLPHYESAGNGSTTRHGTGLPNLGGAHQICQYPLAILLFSRIVASGLLTYFVLYQYSDLALAIPFAYRNPAVAIWIMTVGLGFLSGLLVACINVLFMVPAGKNYRWRQLTLALLPTLFIAVPIYSLARLITG